MKMGMNWLAPGGVFQNEMVRPSHMGATSSHMGLHDASTSMFTVHLDGQDTRVHTLLTPNTALQATDMTEDIFQVFTPKCIL
jgi:hypothetical protein